EPVEGRGPVGGRLAVPVDAEHRRLGARPVEAERAGQLHCFRSSRALLADATRASRGLAFFTSAFWTCCWVYRSHSLYQGALMLVRARAWPYCWLRTSRSQPASRWTLIMSGSLSRDMNA